MWSLFFLSFFVFYIVYKVIVSFFKGFQEKESGITINNYTTEQHLHIDEKFLNK